MRFIQKSRRLHSLDRAWRSQAHAPRRRNRGRGGLRGDVSRRRDQHGGAGRDRSSNTATPAGVKPRTWSSPSCRRRAGRTVSSSSKAGRSRLPSRRTPRPPLRRQFLDALKPIRNSPPDRHMLQPFANGAARPRRRAVRSTWSSTWTSSAAIPRSPPPRVPLVTGLAEASQ